MIITLELINDYLQDKIDYKTILDKKSSVDNATKYYEELNLSKEPKIKGTVINNKKISKTLQYIITLIDEDKLRRRDDFIKKAIELPWMFSKDIYENANDELFARYQKDTNSLELLSIQTFLSNINRGYIKDKKDV